MSPASRILWSWSALTLLVASIATATPGVTGTVSFNSLTGLYDYKYVLDNTGGPSNVTQLYIQINSFAYSGFSPRGFASPVGNFVFAIGAVAGGSCPEYGECGGFWSWSTPNPLPNGLQPGETLSGFEFQTTVAPSASKKNDYSIYYPNEGGFAVFGNVVAPDYMLPAPVFPLVPTPEPSTALMFALGAVPLGILVKSRHDSSRRCTSASASSESLLAK